MGMVSNAVGIIIKWKNGSETQYVLEMGNEQSLDLNTDKTLFDGVTKTDELINSFNRCFLDPFDEGYDFKANVEYWDEGDYKKFIAKLRKRSVSDISYICLFTDEAFDFCDRRYKLTKYGFDGDDSKRSFFYKIDIMKEPPYYDSYDAGIKRIKELIGG